MAMHGDDGFSPPAIDAGRPRAPLGRMAQLASQLLHDAVTLITTTLPVPSPPTSPRPSNGSSAPDSVVAAAGFDAADADADAVNQPGVLVRELLGTAPQSTPLGDVGDAQRHPVLASHPLVTTPPYLRSLMALPLTDARGRRIGAFVVGSPSPDAFSASDRATLKEWAALAQHEVRSQQTLNHRSQIEEALYETEWRFHKLVEHIREAFWIRTADEVLFASPSVQEVFGFSPLYFYDHPDAYFERVHPDDQDVLRSQVDAIRSGEAKVSATVRYYHPNGSLRWIRSWSVAVAVEDGEPMYAGISEDITEHRKRESELREAYQRVESYIQHSPLAFVEFDADHRICRWSAQAEALFGYTEAEALGYTAAGRGIIHPDDVAHVEQSVSAWGPDTERGIVVHNRNVTRDGDVLHCAWYSTVLTDADGHVTSILSLVEDVTDRVRYERELVEAREKAEESNRLKSAFLANMSHEIRTPLSSIIGFAEVLSERVDGELGQLATLIQRGGTRLMETLNSVLDLAQISSEAIDLCPTPGDVRDDVQTAVDLLAGKSESDALDVHAHLPNAPVSATLDHTALGRVLSNLLSNAVKFTEEGSVTVSLSADPDVVQIRIEDTGIGIDPSFREHVFDEFRQESGGMRRSHEGSGLGLAITKQLVTLMHGTIAVGSTQGVGTVFTVRLPRTPPPSDDA